MTYNYTFLILFLSIAAYPLAGQSCYEKYLQLGKRLYDTGYPDSAILQFKAARICSDAPRGDSIEFWISRAQNAYIETLKQARDEAQSSATRAMANALAANAWNVYRDDHTLALRLAEAALRIDSNSEEVMKTLQNIVNQPASKYYKTVLKNQEFAVHALQFSPNAQMLAVGAWDGALLFYDLNGNLLHQVISGRNGNKVGHKKTIHDIAWAADGTSLLTASADGSIKWWTASGEWKKTFSFSAAEVLSVDIAPDGQSFVAGGRDSLARIVAWEGSVVQTLQGHTADITSVAWSPDGKYLLTGGKDATARLWDTAGSIILTLEHPMTVTSVAFSPDGRLILTACADRTAKLWDMDGRQQSTFYGHSGEVIEAVFSPDGKYVLTGSTDKKARIWTTNGEEVAALVGHWEKIIAVAWSPDGRYVATGGIDNTAKIWNTRLNIVEPHYHTAPVNAVAVSGDGQQIATGSRDFTVKLWDHDGRYLKEFNQHTDQVYVVAFSPDGKTLLTGGRDRRAFLWDTRSNTSIALPGHTAEVGGGAFSPDGKWIVTAEHNGMIHLWRSNGQAVKAWPGHDQSKITSAEFSPDSRYLLTAGNDGSACVWDVQGNLITRIHYEVEVYSAVFSPDGKYIYVTAQQFPIDRWKLNGDFDRKYIGHNEVSHSIAFPAAGDKFVTGSLDQTAKVWDTSGVLLHNLIHPNTVFDVATSPAGDFFVTGCRDDRVRIFNFGGKLLGTIGGFEQSVDKMLHSPEIEQLNNIPVSLSRYGIPMEYREVIFSKRPKDLFRLGWELENQATRQTSEFESGNQNFEKAIDIYREARLKMNGADAIWADSILAACYKKWTDHLLANQHFSEAIATARAGMAYKKLEYLQVLEVIATLYNGDLDGALRLGRPLKDKPIHEISWYPDFNEAFLGELYYFQNFGIKSPLEPAFSAEFSRP